MSPAEELERVLGQLRRRFEDELPGRLARIRDLARALPGDPDAASALRTEVHNIAGTAGTLGHPLLSQAAARVDEQLARGPGEGLDHALLMERVLALRPDPAPAG
jgi:HPt (histidine-containing phosphotransfer) domain-containing protein